MCSSGKLQAEAAAAPDSAFDDHSSAVCFGCMLHDAQSDACAFGFAAKLRAVSIEEIEDLAVLFRWNAGAVVDDPEANQRGQQLHFDAHFTIGGGMFDGVIEQIHEALFDGFAVPGGLQVGELRWRID